jgi:hypothetical protein
MVTKTSSLSNVDSATLTSVTPVEGQNNALQTSLTFWVSLATGNVLLIVSIVVIVIMVIKRRRE